MTLPRAAQSSHHSELWHRALLASALVFLLHLAWMIAGRGNAAVVSSGSYLLSLAEGAVATIALTTVAAQTLRRKERGRYGWAFLALALFANSLGDIAWWLISRTHGEVPFPSIADLIYFSFYPLFALGLALLPAVPHGPGQRLRLWLDMGSALLAGALLFWVLGVGPALAGARVGSLEVAVAIAYPAGDMALFWALLLLITRRVPPAKRPALGLLATGTAVMLASDWLFSLQVIKDTYRGGNLVDLGYTLMLILFALAAVRERIGLDDERGARPAPADDRAAEPLVNWSMAMPYVAMLLAFALLVWDHFNPTGIRFPVLVGALGAIILLSSIRQLLAIGENEALRQSERDLTASLLRARDELEARVADRTRALRLANAALAAEVAQHEAAEARLQESLREKEALLKEVHHRVKNNLQIVTSLFNLQSGSSRDPLLAEALVDGQARIRAMSLIHEKLYASPDLAQLDFGDYLHGLVAHLYRLYRPYAAPVRLELNVPAVWLNADAVVPCGLIVNELVANALKHAFPDGRSGVVRVELAPEREGWLRLSVIDDGIGLPPDFDLSRTESLGLQLATMLAKQIEGELTIKQDRGARCDLIFPVPAASS